MGFAFAFPLYIVNGVTDTGDTWTTLEHLPAVREWNRAETAGDKRRLDRDASFNVSNQQLLCVSSAAAATEEEAPVERERRRGTNSLVSTLRQLAGADRSSG